MATKTILLKPPPSLDKLTGHRSLLLGEPNTGKTLFTLRFVEFLLRSQLYTPRDISILDFAPPRTPFIRLGAVSIGGTFRELLQDTSLFPPSSMKLLGRVHWVGQEYETNTGAPIPVIQTPRRSATNIRAVLQACCANFTATSPQLQYFITHITPVLVINDIGIYLHAGSLRTLRQAIDASEIALLNAYYGQSLRQDFGANISWREHVVLQLLTYRLDAYYALDFK